MKWLLLLVLIIPALAVPGQVVHKPKQYHVIRHFSVDLNNDGKTDNITLSSNDSIKDHFNRIDISLTGYQKETFYAKEFWTTVDESFLNSNKNAVPSPLLFIKKTPKQTVILLFGYLYEAGIRSGFTIIDIENNSIKRLLDDGEQDDVEWPVTLTHLKGAEKLCFVYGTLSEFEGFSSELQKQKGIADIESYSPYYVYPIDDPYSLSEPLTKIYNEEHYVVPDSGSTGDIHVLCPQKGGKYKIWTRKITH